MVFDGNLPASGISIIFNSILFTLIRMKYNIFYSKKKIKHAEQFILMILLSREVVGSGQRSKAFVLATTSVQLQIKWGKVEFITLVVELC